MIKDKNDYSSTQLAWVFSICALLFSGTAVSDIYSWKDSSGKTHFSDTPPDSISNGVSKVTITEDYEPISLKTRKIPKWNGVGYKSKKKSAKITERAKDSKNVPQDPVWLTKARKKCNKEKKTNCSNSYLRGMNDPALMERNRSARYESQFKRSIYDNSTYIPKY